MKTSSWITIAAFTASLSFTAQAQITADFIGANNAAIDDTAHWSGGVLPNQAGDVGNATVSVNISDMGATNWAGTLNLTGDGDSGANAQLRLDNASTTGTWSDVNLAGNAWLRAAANRDTSFGNVDSNITIAETGGRFYRSGATGTRFNIWGSIHVNGLLQTDAESSHYINIRNLLYLNEGNAVQVNAGVFESNVGSTIHFTFADNGDRVSQIYGAAINSRVLIRGHLDIDVSGFESDQTAKRSWQLLDWDSLVPASGFEPFAGVNFAGTLRTGATTWTIASGTERFYNEENGLVWTYTDPQTGIEWTFTESTGILTNNAPAVRLILERSNDMQTWEAVEITPAVLSESGAVIVTEGSAYRMRIESID